MPRIPCRKFTLADAMILMASTAAGLAVIRGIHRPPVVGRLALAGFFVIYVSVR